ncbi:stress enhanced protein 2 chloroplastic [Phtheirospermum japonicum]|uniref:Stress enhanced protein 2 chloroplastic n=1 Tax=Phtheirospermum japonicum TaxID=374723 RepID=A0A830BQW3_9LAMI|nr:stress enhanced protein 2 chloroplastic [Phtheirospermum japonicum]
MARAPRHVFCQLRAEKPSVPEYSKLRGAAETPSDGGGKIVLQPRVCTLRSFGGDRGGVIRGNRENEVSQFFEVLTDYVESSKKSHDFEIISGRLAMIVFAATVGLETVTGNSLFTKTDLQGIEEGAGICMAAIASATLFAWFSSNRNRVGRIFTIGCNTFIDALIDQIIDGLFYDTDISD